MTTTTSTKLTNKNALLYAIAAIKGEALPAGFTDADVTAKLETMIAQLDKKNASPKKMTAQQEKNEGVKEAIMDFLLENDGVGYTVSDLLKNVPACEGDSNQHVSALMRALVLAGSVERYTENRHTYFRASADGVLTDEGE